MYRSETLPRRRLAASRRPNGRRAPNAHLRRLEPGRGGSSRVAETSRSAVSPKPGPARDSDPVQGVGNGRIPGPRCGPSSHRRPTGGSTTDGRYPGRASPPRQPAAGEMKRTTAVKASLSSRRLSRSDEGRLAKRIKHGHLEARERMIESNLVLVHAVARDYRGRGVQFDDLVQEGTVGLVRAVDGSDPRRGVKFSTCAVWWIRRSMFDALAGSNVIGSPPRRTSSSPQSIGRGRARADRATARFGLRDCAGHATERGDRALAAHRGAGDCVTRPARRGGHPASRRPGRRRPVRRSVGGRN